MKIPLHTREFFLLFVIFLAEVYSAPLEKQSTNGAVEGHEEGKKTESKSTDGKTETIPKRDETQPIQALKSDAPVHTSKAPKSLPKAAQTEDDSPRAKNNGNKPAISAATTRPKQAKVQKQDKPQAFSANPTPENSVKPRPSIFANKKTEQSEQAAGGSLDTIMTMQKPSSFDKLDFKFNTDGQEDFGDGFQPGSNMTEDNSGKTEGGQYQNEESAGMAGEGRKPNNDNAPYVETQTGYQVETIDDNNEGEDPQSFHQDYGADTPVVDTHTYMGGNGGVEGNGGMGGMGGTANLMESDRYDDGLTNPNAMTGDGEMAEALGGRSIFEKDGPVMGLGDGAMRGLAAFGNGEAGRQVINGMLGGGNQMNQFNSFQSTLNPEIAGAGLGGLLGGANAMNGLGGLGANTVPSFAPQPASNAWYKSGISSPLSLIGRNQGLLNLQALGVRRMVQPLRVVPQMLLMRPNTLGAVMGKKRGKLSRPSHKVSKRRHKTHRGKNKKRTKSTIAHHRHHHKKAH